MFNSSHMSSISHYKPYWVPSKYNTEQLLAKYPLLANIVTQMLAQIRFFSEYTIILDNLKQSFPAHVFKIIL